MVRDIFVMKLCGMNEQAIAEKLNADGILASLINLCFQINHRACILFITNYTFHRICTPITFPVTTMHLRSFPLCLSNSLGQEIFLSFRLRAIPGYEEAGAETSGRVGKG